MSLSALLSHQQPAADLAKTLGCEGIRSLLNLMCEAYQDLLACKFVRRDTPEDSITEQWFLKLQLRWKKSNISAIPIHQMQDMTKGKKGKRAPTVDFCFRDEQFPPGSYFGAECKLLDSTPHFREYISDRGMGRFLDGRYAHGTSAGAMIGYVRVGNPQKVADKVSEDVLKLPGKPCMKKSAPLTNFQDIYESNHKRTSGISPFQIFHLFYSFHADG